MKKYLIQWTGERRALFCLSADSVTLGQGKMQLLSRGIHLDTPDRSKRFRFFYWKFPHLPILEEVLTVSNATEPWGKD